MDILNDIQGRNWNFLNNQIQYMGRALANVMNDPRLEPLDRPYVAQRYVDIITALQNERQRRVNEFHRFQTAYHYSAKKLPRAAIVEIGRAIYNGVRLPANIVNGIIDLTDDDEDE